MAGTKKVALFDLDGTLADFNLAMQRSLKELESPEETHYGGRFRDMPDYLRARRNLIMSSRDWWSELPKFQLGWDVLELARKIGFDIHILTQGPMENSAAWEGKKLWVDRNLGKCVDMTITRDKGLVYGRILVDDFPGYAERWLKWRKRGLVIMPAGPANKDYEHKNVVIYNGSNLAQVDEVMQKAFDRKSPEEVIF